MVDTGKASAGEALPASISSLAWSKEMASFQWNRRLLELFKEPALSVSGNTTTSFPLVLKRVDSTIKIRIYSWKPLNKPHKRGTSEVAGTLRKILPVGC